MQARAATVAGSRCYGCRHLEGEALVLEGVLPVLPVGEDVARTHVHHQRRRAAAAVAAAIAAAAAAPATPGHVPATPGDVGMRLRLSGSRLWSPASLTTPTARAPTPAAPTPATGVILTIKITDND